MKRPNIWLWIGLAGAVGLYLYSKTQSGSQTISCAVSNVITGISGMFPNNWLSYGTQYLPTINATEQQYGLPTNFLAAVAYQESAFNPDAFNPSGATGMFQLMPQFFPGAGNSWSTDARTAAKYLASLYNQFGDWQMALAAYNWGPGNLNNLVAGGDVSLSQLPSETQNYVTRIAGATGVQGALA